MNKKYNRIANRIALGMAKVEYLANENLINELLTKGYNYTMIYNELKKQNKITMKYISLVSMINKHNNIKNNVQQPKLIKKIKIKQKNEQSPPHPIEQPKHHTKLKEKNDTFMMENYDPVGNSQQNEKKENN